MVNLDPDPAQKHEDPVDPDADPDPEHCLRCTRFGIIWGLRVQEAQKHVDLMDPDPQHCLKGQCHEIFCFWFF
jgi:hypothetical protein